MGYLTVRAHSGNQGLVWRAELCANRMVRLGRGPGGSEGLRAAVRQPGAWPLAFGAASRVTLSLHC